MICTTTSNQRGHMHVIYIPDSSSPNLRGPSQISSSAATLRLSICLTCSPPWKFPLPWPPGKSTLLGLPVHNFLSQSLIPHSVQLCCVEGTFSRGVACDIKKHSEVTRKGIHCHISLADTGKSKAVSGLLRAFIE